MKVINLVDPKGRISLMYSIDKPIKEGTTNTKLERLESKSQNLGDKIRRSFYLDANNDKDIIVLSIMKEQVFVNVATYSKGILKLASVSTKINFIETKKSETVEVYYTPTVERKIFIIDIETGNEVEPDFDVNSIGEMKGIVNLEAGKKYVTIELRDKAFRSILIGAAQLLIENNILKLYISKEEAKRIRVDKYIELINSGKCIEQKLKDASLEKEI